MEKYLRLLWLVVVMVLIGACAVDPGGGGGGAGGGGTGGGAAPTPDTTPPTLVVSSPTNRQEVGAVYTLHGTVSDDGSGVLAVYVALNDNAVFGVVPVVNGAWTTNIALAVYGPHTNYVYAKDNASNVTATNVIEVIRAAIPALIVTAPTEGWITSNASVAVSGTVSVDAPYVITRVEVSLDGINYSEAAHSGGTWSTNITLVNEGTNRIRVRATADNNKTTEVIRTVVLDTTAPTVAITAPAAGSEVGTTYTLSGTVSDNIAIKAVFVRLNTGVYRQVAVSGGNWSTNITLSAYGLHTNHVYAEDMAGNLSPVAELVVERPAIPVIAFSSPAEGIITNAVPLAFAGTVSIDAPFTITRVEVSLDGTNYSEAAHSGGTWSTNITLVNEGTNTIRARATANNGRTNVVTRRVVFDTTAPTVAITAPAAGSEVGTTYTLSGTVSDNIAIKAVFVRLNTGVYRQVAVSGGNWSTNITLSAYGLHTNHVYAVDMAGNLSPVAELVVERPAIPVIAFSSPAEGIITNAVPLAFAGTVSIDAPFTITRVEVSLDGTNYSEAAHSGGTWSTNITLVNEGTNTIRAKATANNGRTTVVTRRVVLDSIRPTLTVTSHTNFQLVPTNYVLAGSAPDATLDRVMVSVNGGAYVQASLSGSSWNHAVTITSGTLQTNDIYALDRAGNTSLTNRIILTNAANLPWTIMVFMNGDNNREANAMETLNEIEAGLAGAAGRARVVVLVDRSPAHDTSDGNWVGTRLYYMEHDSGGMNGTVISRRLAGMGLSDTGDTDERNMGDPAVLQAFVDYARTFFPATNTMLIVWGIGDGWRSQGIVRTPPSVVLRSGEPHFMPRQDNPLRRGDVRSMFPTFERTPHVTVPQQDGSPDVMRGIGPDGSSANNMLNNSEVRTALTGRGITMLGMDASMMGMLEVAYEWRHLAEYLIASPDIVMGDGWEYDQWLPSFLSSGLSKINLYQAIVDTYAIRHATDQFATMAVYDLSRIDALFSAFEVYVTNLYNDLLNPARDPRAEAHFLPVYTNVEGFTAPVHGGFHHVDVFDLADKLDRGGGAAVRTALQNAVVYEWNHAGGDIITGNPRSSGMALYYWTWQTNTLGQIFPHVRPDYVLSNFTLFNQASLWDLYIDAVANYQLDTPWLANNVNMSGTLVTNRDFKRHQFYVAQPGTVTATLSWTGGMDFDLYLLDVRTGAFLGFAETLANPETVTRTIAHPGWYVLIAASWTGTGGYTINVRGSGATPAVLR